MVLSWPQAQSRGRIRPGDEASFCGTLEQALSVHPNHSDYTGGSSIRLAPMLLFCATFTTCHDDGPRSRERGANSAGSAAPNVSPPLSVGSVVKRVGLSFRSSGPGFTGGHSTFSVAVDGRGIISFALAADLGSALELTTVLIRRGQPAVKAAGIESRVDHEGTLHIGGAGVSAETASGTHFARVTSGPGLRYGRATWVDARGKRTPSSWNQQQRSTAPTT